MTEQTQERAVRPCAAIVQEHRDGGIVARLGYRPREQKLVIGDQLVRPDDVVRASLSDNFDRLRDHRSDEVAFLRVPDLGGSR